MFEGMFPGDLVVRIWHLHWGAPDGGFSSIPSRGPEILQAMQPNFKPQNKNKQNMFEKLTASYHLW